MENLSFALGLLGSVLGILATWSGLVRDRPKVKVHVVWLVVTPRGLMTARRPEAIREKPEGQVGIKLINTGYAAVRICEVGVCPGRIFWKQRFSEFPEPPARGAVNDDAFQEVTFPYELLPGTSVTIALAPSTLHSPAMARARSAYALSCDERLFVGRNRLLRALADKARSAAS